MTSRNIDSQEYRDNIKILSCKMLSVLLRLPLSGADQGFQVRRTHLKKLRRAKGGSKILEVFRVKNHDFTPKNHIFSNCGGRRENFWDISYEKSRFYAKISDFFQF